MIENTPTLTTERLILRKFEETDAEALLDFLSDEEVNRFLPFFPLKTIEEAKQFLQERYLSTYTRNQGYHYAICLKEDNCPIGYVCVSCTQESHDFGYALKKEYWHQGITTEASFAVLDRVKKEGIPYITATHDVLNPRSGGVMKKLKMRYCYSYVEQWQPKDIPVTFRMYQLNLDDHPHPIYQKYWDETKEHFIEQIEA